MVLDSLLLGAMFADGCTNCQCGRESAQVREMASAGEEWVDKCYVTYEEKKSALVQGVFYFKDASVDDAYIPAASPTRRK
jgi:hypothetical protein